MVGIVSILVKVSWLRPVRPSVNWRNVGHLLVDPEVEAFCRIYARVVLRIKGLAGFPRAEDMEEGVEHESA